MCDCPRSARVRVLRWYSTSLPFELYGTACVESVYSRCGYTRSFCVVSHSFENKKSKNLIKYSLKVNWRRAPFVKCTLEFCVVRKQRIEEIVAESKNLLLEEKKVKPKTQVNEWMNGISLCSDDVLLCQNDPKCKHRTSSKAADWLRSSSAPGC